MSRNSGFSSAADAPRDLAAREAAFHDHTWRRHMEEASRYLDGVGAPSRVNPSEALTELSGLDALVRPGDISSPELVLRFRSNGRTATYRARNHSWYDCDEPGPVHLCDPWGEPVDASDCSPEAQGAYEWLVVLIPTMRVWLARKGTDNLTAQDLGLWWEEVTGRAPDEVSLATDVARTMWSAARAEEKDGLEDIL